MLATKNVYHTYIFVLSTFTIISFLSFCNSCVWILIPLHFPTELFLIGGKSTQQKLWSTQECFPCRKKTQRGKIFFLLSYSFKYKHLTNLIFSFQSVIFQCPPLIEISDLFLENFCLFVCYFLYTKGSLIQDYQFRQIRIIRTSFHSIKRRPMSTDTSSNVHGNNTLHL